MDGQIQMDIKMMDRLMSCWIDGGLVDGWTKKIDGWKDKQTTHSYMGKGRFWFYFTSSLNQG